MAIFRSIQRFINEFGTPSTVEVEGTVSPSGGVRNIASGSTALAAFELHTMGPFTRNPGEVLWIAAYVSEPDVGIVDNLSWNTDQADTNGVFAVPFRDSTTLENQFLVFVQNNHIQDITWEWAILGFTP